MLCNFSNIKLFVAEVYGENTQIDFEKIHIKEDKEETRTIQPSVATSQLERKVEIPSEQVSSCVSSMSLVKNPNLSQKDLNINDVLNSKMVNTAMKLFQSPHSPRIKSKI